MVAQGNIVAGWLDRWATPDNMVVLGLIALALLGLVVTLFAVMLLSRRRLVAETREIVVALEELRSGSTERSAAASPGSPLALVFDALGRLNQDLAGRQSRNERTAQRLQAVGEAVRDGAIVTTDLDGDIRSFSPGAASLFGWDESEASGRPASMLFDDEAFRQFLPKLSRRSLRERGVDSRSVMQRRDGETFQADVSVNLLHNDANDATGFVLVVRDVTHQASLERELRESELRYRTLVDGLNEGVAIVQGGLLKYTNPAFVELCGLPEERLVGSPLRERVATQDLLLVEDRLTELERERGASERLRCQLLDSEGDAAADVELEASCVEFAGERALLLVLRDETSNRRVEEELRRNETQLDAMLEATADGILMLVRSHDGGVVQVMNRAFAELFDLREEQLLGVHESRLTQLLREVGGGAGDVAEFIEASAEVAMEASFVLSRQTQREFEIASSPLSDRRGVPIGRLLICRDLTEHRESERRLQQHAEELQLSKVMLEQSYEKLDAVNRDLQGRTEELDNLNSELRTLDEMKTKLLGNVSHELQTPLVSIRGYTEMILKERLGPVSEEQRRGLSLCLKNIDRLISMIDNLLVFSKKETEDTSLQLSEFALRGLIEEVDDLLADKMQARGIVLTCEIDADGPWIQADRDRIQQVFINLVSNAIKFNKAGGSIALRVRDTGASHVEVEVEDTGIGIPEADLEKVFERNYQVARSGDPSPQGSGIGLAIVRDILRVHGCRVRVESEEGRFTRFVFTLPRAKGSGVELSREADPGMPEDSSAPKPPSPPEGPRRRSGPTPPTARPRFRVIRRGE